MIYAVIILILFLCILSGTNLRYKKHHKPLKNIQEKDRILTIDAKNEIHITIKSLVARYEEFCNYPEILSIAKDDRLTVLKYVWRFWDERINYKNYYKKFAKYSKDILNRIEQIESGRRHLYFKIYEFSKRKMSDDKEMLIEISDLKPETKICKLDDLTQYYEYWIRNSDEDDIAPNYLQMPPSLFLAKDFFEFTYLFSNNQFKEITKEELKDFCNKNNYVYPYKN